MLFMTINDRYDELMKAIDELKKNSSRMKRIGTQIVNTIYRFMQFELKINWDHDDEEQRKYVLCAFFDNKYFDDMRFANRYGVGQGQISYIKAVDRMVRERSF